MTDTRRALADPATGKLGNANVPRTKGELPGLDFQGLFQLYHKPIYAFFANQGLPRADAQELTQDTFLKAFQAHDRFRGEASVRTWLIAIAKNVLYNHYRDRNRLKRQAHERSFEIMREEGSLGAREADQRAGPLEEYLNQEQRCYITQAIAHLPPQMRDCLLAHWDEGLKYREIAEVHKLSLDRVKDLLFQARQRLTSHLKDVFAANGGKPSVERRYRG